MICEKANTPISTGRKGMPPSSQRMPRLRRGWPITGSLPITVITRPIAPARSPLVIDSPVRPATIDSAKMKSEKYSQGPNSSANDASGPVVPTRNTPPSRPPKKDAQMPSHSALPGSPFFAIGKPSNMVATDEGLPGMPSRQEVMRPPDSPPMYTPIIAERPCSGSRPKVKGSTMITVMVLVIPGIAPPTTPIKVPIASGTKYLVCKTVSMPESRSSYIG
jgi:hypothetical protein